MLSSGKYQKDKKAVEKTAFIMQDLHQAKICVKLSMDWLCLRK